MSSSPYTSPNHASIPLNIVSPSYYDPPIWTLSKCHRTLRPLKSKLQALKNFIETYPSTSGTIPPILPNLGQYDAGKILKKYTSHKTKVLESSSRPSSSYEKEKEKEKEKEFPSSLLTSESLLKSAKAQSKIVSISQFYSSLYSTLLTLLKTIYPHHSSAVKIHSQISQPQNPFYHHRVSSLAILAAHSHGIFAFQYELQSTQSLSARSTPSFDNEEISMERLTLDDFLRDHCPPHHRPTLILGYTTALITYYLHLKPVQPLLSPLMPSLIVLFSELGDRDGASRLLRELVCVVEQRMEYLPLFDCLGRTIGKSTLLLEYLVENLTLEEFIHPELSRLLSKILWSDLSTKIVVKGYELAIAVFRSRKTNDESGLYDITEKVLTNLIILGGKFILSHHRTSIYPLLYMSTQFPAYQAHRKTIFAGVNLAVQAVLAILLEEPFRIPPLSLPPATKYLDFRPLRQIFSNRVLFKRLIEERLLHPNFLSWENWGIRILRDWSKHIDPDEEHDDGAYLEDGEEWIESSLEWAARIEREWATRRWGLEWKFEPIVQEWVCVTPGKPALLADCYDLSIDEDEGEEEEGQSLQIKQDNSSFSPAIGKVKRSGLLDNTPFVKLFSRSTETVKKNYINDKDMLKRWFKLCSSRKVLKTNRGTRPVERSSPLERMTTSDQPGIGNIHHNQIMDDAVLELEVDDAIMAKNKDINGSSFNDKNGDFGSLDNQHSTSNFECTNFLSSPSPPPTNSSRRHKLKRRFNASFSDQEDEESSLPLIPLHLTPLQLASQKQRSLDITPSSAGAQEDEEDEFWKCNDEEGLRGVILPSQFNSQLNQSKEEKWGKEEIENGLDWGKLKKDVTIAHGESMFSPKFAEDHHQLGHEKKEEQFKVEEDDLDYLELSFLDSQCDRRPSRARQHFALQQSDKNNRATTKEKRRKLNCEGMRKLKMIWEELWEDDDDDELVM